MSTIVCPHCGKTPASGLHRFMPGVSFVRGTFKCSECSGLSIFSGRVSIIACIASLGTMMLTLWAVRWYGDGELSLALYMVLLAGVIVLHQFVSAAILRRYARLHAIDSED
ncbi:hypothetical protein [Lysobacter sp. Root604]|uniref:hypothetical protein n=1 Tax=Lysobacter sp. Root604 TaxID=1736568 RepID=UPI0012F97683|nr:hypothetical protein [Lysobacter sp. Root604]